MRRLTHFSCVKCGQRPVVARGFRSSAFTPGFLVMLSIGDSAQGGCGSVDVLFDKGTVVKVLFDKGTARAQPPGNREDGVDGPRLVVEPPSMVHFSTDMGAVLPCSAQGRPAPSIAWEMADGSPAHAVAGLRETRPDGSLVLLPIGPSQFLPEVHAATYRCVASSRLGLVKSRLAHVRGVVPENFVAGVQDVYVIRGNAAILRCHLPVAVKEFVSVTAWIRDDGVTVGPMSGSRPQDRDSRYFMLPTGELVVRDMSPSEAFRSYRCQVRNSLTAQSHISATAGKIVVTEPLSELTPRVTESRRVVEVEQRRDAVLPCVAQGHPPPRHTWFRLSDNVRDRGSGSGGAGDVIPVRASERVSLLGGRTVLVLHSARLEDGGRYFCLANNSAGQDKVYTDVVVTAPLTARIEPSVQLVDTGRGANLTCRAAGRPVRGILWTHNGIPVFPSAPSTILGSATRGLPTKATTKRAMLLSNDVLRLVSVEREDGGMYQCFVYNRDDSAQGTAQIIIREDAPVLENVFQQLQVTPGSSASLRCSASGNPLPQVTWTLDGDAVPEGYHIRIGDYVSSERLVHSYVNLTGVRVEDGGLYACAARNSVGQASHSARLVVPGKPVMRRPVANITALAGRSMALRCPVAGHPIHSIAWEKEGRWLPQNHRQRSFPNGTLVVTQVQRSQDSGWYGCTARDKQGNSARAQLGVRVMTPPAVSPFSFPDDLTEGKRAGAACVVSDGDLPISIAWLKDGRPLDTQALGATVSRTNDYTSFLSVVGVRQGVHSGFYTCVAFNPAASANFTAPMVVRVGPRWRHEPADKAAVLGQQVVFNCQADGFPVPVIRWKKEQLSDDGSRLFVTITSSAHARVLENGSLVINDAELSDAARYLCQVQNGVGPGTSAVVKLDVNVAAHFEQKFQALTVRRGDSASLNCRADGDPPIKLTWTRDGRPFAPSLEEPRYMVQESTGSGWSESLIHITGCERQDSSLFTCRAQNAYGTDETSFQVIVQEAPDKPRGLEVTQSASRSVTLAWLPPYSGNSPVLEYVLEHKNLAGSWEYDTHVSAVKEPMELSQLVTGLRPATSYEFRIRAGNAFGLSDHSDPLIVTTDQEAPSGVPLDIKATATGSRTVLVTWKPPLDEESHGTVQGYYVGYRVIGSGQRYSYKTLDGSGEPAAPPVRQQCRLAELRRHTSYGIVVQAFNSKGAGPASEEVAVQTLDIDPPAAPRLKLVSSTSSSINLSWDVFKDQPVDGYLLFHKLQSDRVGSNSASPGMAPWPSVKTGAERSSYAYRGLHCGRSYTFYAVAFNGAGRGPRSNAVLAKTDGSAPLAPEVREFVVANVTWVTLRLNSWRSGGCPILSFTVLYKCQSHGDWEPAATGLVPEQVLPQPPQLSIEDLTPATWYQLLVTARNEAGTTEAEYVFATLTLSGATVPAPHWTQVIESQRRRIHVIVPVVCTILVVLLVTIAVLYAMYQRRLTALRRRRLVWHPGDADIGSFTGATKSVDTVPMTVWEKPSQQEHNAASRPDQLYLTFGFRVASPGPVTKSCGGRSYSWASSRGLATVHEDTELAGSGEKLREHTYDVPFAPRHSMQKLQDRDDLLASAERLATCMAPKQDSSNATPCPEEEPEASHVRSSNLGIAGTSGEV
ncbi:cell adhesion molecule Dscam1-like [Haemaphysalis longicornis]